MTLAHWPILFFDRKRSWTHGLLIYIRILFLLFLPFFLGTNWSTGGEIHTLEAAQPILFQVPELSNSYLNVDVSKSYF